MALFNAIVTMVERADVVVCLVGLLRRHNYLPIPKDGCTQQES